MQKASFSTFGFVLFSIIVPVIGGLISVFLIFLKSGRAGKKPTIRELVLKGLEGAGIALGAVLITTLGAYAIFFVPTIYNIHNSQSEQITHLTYALHEKNRGITTDDPAYMGLVQILSEFQSYGASMRGHKCTIYFSATPDSLKLAQAISETSALVSTCHTFGPDATGTPDSISNKEDGMVPGIIVVHSTRENHAAISFQRRVGSLLPTEYSYIPPKNPSFAITDNFMWLQFGSGVGWRQ